MITENLFYEILVKPVQDGANELLVVSGYASANMAYRHMDQDLVKARGVKVKLVYGMAPSDGVLLADHEGFKRLEGNGLFECHYRVDPPAVHSKVFVWMADGDPVKAFIGSANYTQPGFGFGRNNGEAMAEVDPHDARGYFERILQGAIESSHDDVEDRIVFYRHDPRSPDNADYRTVSFLSVRAGGEVPDASGLNWGHSERPSRRQNFDEAYIQLGAQLGREDFFPPRPNRFTIVPDEGPAFTAVRAQKQGEGDAIETPENNAILGEYFRRRMGLPYGTRFTKALLEAYGRTDVTFRKTDHDEIYEMDFSVHP